MRGADRSYARKLLKRIGAGDFDDHDLRNLLIRLRPYSSGCPAFLEASHFVAHGDIRDQGLIADSMKAFDNRVRHWVSYFVEGKQVDFNSPFPSYIYDLAYFQAGLHEKDLRREFKCSPKQLRDLLKSAFTVDPIRKLAIPRGKLPEHTFLPIRCVIERIGGVPAFDDRVLYRDFLSVLKKNDLFAGELQLDRQRDAIVVGMLAVMHGTPYRLGDSRKGALSITSRYQWRKVGVELCDGGHLFDEDALGLLNLSAYIFEEAFPWLSEHSHGTCFPIITTSLPALRYLDSSLVHQAPIGHQDLIEQAILLEPDLIHPSAIEASCVFIIESNLECDVAFSNGKLTRISEEK